MNFDFCQELYNKNSAKRGAKNLNTIITGESGSGKSYLALRICELYYKNHLNKEFNVRNVVFTISELLERIYDLEKKSCIIFDDSGLTFSSVKWYDELNQIAGYVLQSYRYKIINLFFTVPNSDWIDRIGRGMLHSQIEMKALGKAAYHRLYYNNWYKKRFNPRTFILDAQPPGQELINAYEDKKHKFLEGEYKKYIKRAKIAEGSDITKLSVLELLEVVKKDLKAYTLDNKVSAALIRSKLGISHHKSRDIIAMLKAGN